MFAQYYFRRVTVTAARRGIYDCSWNSLERMEGTMTTSKFVASVVHWEGDTAGVDSESDKR